MNLALVTEPTNGATKASSTTISSTAAKRLFLRMARPSPEANPYPLYARLREIGPVVPVHFPGVTPRYLITTFAACTAMLRDDAVEPPTEEHFHETNPTWKQQGLARSLFGSMAFRSGIAHRLERGMVARYFSPRRIAQLRPEIEELAETLLTQVAVLGAAGKPVDIERDLAVPYSATIIGRLLGVPDDHALRLGWLIRQAGAILELAPSPAQRRQATQAGEQALKELTALADERRRQPGDDMINDLVRQCDPDEERLLSSLALLFSAGFDSPASLVGTGLKLFLDNPEQARLLREDPGLANTAIEEILRCEPVIQIMFRATKRDIGLAGVTIPAGSILLGLVAGALRDPDLVSDPDRFDIRRRPSSGLSFGDGAHYCVGAYLARLAGSILFPRLLRRFPLMRLAGPPTYRAPGVALRGFESLRVVPGRSLQNV
jgi:cytochrome P450